MSRRTAFSVRTLAVLAAFAAEASAWRHGYDVADETGLKSGTLYPIRSGWPTGDCPGLLGEGETAGRPRRHLYRLTSDELAAATAALAAAGPAAVARAAGPRRAAAPRRLAGEGS